MGEPLQILVFEVGGLRYGLAVADVQELLRAVAIVPLPAARPPVEGIINLRGTVIPVLDLRTPLGLPARPLEPADHFVVARAGERLAALRVDRALELVALQPADLADAHSAVPGLEHVTGIVKRPDGLVLIPDLRDFLTSVAAVALPPVEGGSS